MRNFDGPGQKVLIQGQNKGFLKRNSNQHANACYCLFVKDYKTLLLLCLLITKYSVTGSRTRYKEQLHIKHVWQEVILQGVFFNVTVTFLGLELFIFKLECYVTYLCLQNKIRNQMKLIVGRRDLYSAAEVLKVGASKFDFDILFFIENW